MRKTTITVSIIFIILSLVSCTQKKAKNIEEVYYEETAKYNVGIVANGLETSDDDAQTMRDLVLSVLVQSGVSPQETEAEYFVARSEESLLQTLNDMRQRNDLVVALDESSAVITVGLEKESEKDYCPLFYVEAAEKNVEKLHETKLCTGVIKTDNSESLARQCANMMGDGKIGVVYNSDNPTPAETVCTYFDGVGVNYTVASSGAGEAKSAAAELCSLGVCAVIIPGEGYTADLDMTDCPVPVFCSEDFAGATVIVKNDKLWATRVAATAAANYLICKNIPDAPLETAPPSCTVYAENARKHNITPPKTTQSMRVEIVS